MKNTDDIPAEVIAKLEEANARFVDKKVKFKAGPVKTGYEAYPVKTIDTGRWVVHVSFTDRTWMELEVLLSEIA